MRHLALAFLILISALTNGWAQQNSPQEKSIVNKEFDENGNMIQYDSTYIWSWNSDSTFNFSMDDNFVFGKDFPDMFGEFDADSIFEKFGLLNGHKFESFNDEDFLKHFHYSIPDTMIANEFPFENDSVFNFQFGQQFQGIFNFQEWDELQKQINKQFSLHNHGFPESLSPEQREEWNKLIQKQQKEKEELQKKWGK